MGGFFFLTPETPPKVLVHAASQLVEFPVFLKYIADQYSELYRTDKRFLANLDNVVGIDNDERRLIFPNGDKTDVETRRFHEVKTLVQKHLKS